MTILYENNNILNTAKDNPIVEQILIDNNCKMIRFDVSFKLYHPIPDNLKVHILDMRVIDQQSIEHGYQPLYIEKQSFIEKSSFQVYFQNKDTNQRYTANINFDFEANINYQVSIILTNCKCQVYINGNLELDDNIKVSNLITGGLPLYIGRRFTENNNNELNKIDSLGEISNVRISAYQSNDSLVYITGENKLQAVSICEYGIPSNAQISLSQLSASNIIENSYIYANDNCSDISNIQSEQHTKTYLKIFDHNVSSNPADDSSYFTNAEEARKCFKVNKFSRLGDLNSDLFKSDGKYEFLLTYPSMPGDVKYNIWKQAWNPLNKIEGEDEPELKMGYEAVSIAMEKMWGKFDDNSSETTLKGLALNLPTEDSLLDTLQAHQYWWGGLGQYKPYTDGTLNKTGFPSCDGTIETHVQLYVRIDNTPYNAYSMITKTNDVIMNEFIED